MLPGEGGQYIQPPNNYLLYTFWEDTMLLNLLLTIT